MNAAIKKRLAVDGLALALVIVSIYAFCITYLDILHRQRMYYAEAYLAATHRAILNAVHEEPNAAGEADATAQQL